MIYDLGIGSYFDMCGRVVDRSSVNAFLIERAIFIKIFELLQKDDVMCQIRCN